MPNSLNNSEMFLHSEDASKVSHKLSILIIEIIYLAQFLKTYNRNFIFRFKSELFIT